MEKRLLSLFLAAISSVTFYNFGFCAEQNFVVSDQSLSFGHESTEKSIYITNTNPNSDLMWNVQVNVPWLKLEQVQGQIENPSRISANAAYAYSNMWPKLPQPWYFEDPRSVGIDHEGSIYVVDSSRERVMKFNKYEEFLFEVGSDYDYSLNFNQQKDDYLDGPSRIAFDSQNNFYVTTDNNPYYGVKKFDKNGRFLAKINVASCDIAIDSQDNVYITAGQGYSVLKFDKNGRYLKSWGKEGLGNGEFSPNNGPGNQGVGIAIDSKDNIYIADNHYYRIQVFDCEGNFIKKWARYGSEYVLDHEVWDAQTAGVFAIDAQDTIYIGDEHSHGIEEFDTQGNMLGKYIPNLGNIAVDKAGNVYLPIMGITDGKKILKYSQLGKLISEWKSYGSAQGMFCVSSYGLMAVDKNGNLYVYDDYQRIQVFSREGKFINVWDFSSNKYPADLFEGEYPEAMAIDSAGNVFFTVLKANTFLAILKFDAQGNFVQKYKYNKAISGIHGLALDSKDNLYIDEESQTAFLIKLDINGKITEEWDSKKLTDGNNFEVNGLAIDASDNIYIFRQGNDDANNRRISKFNFKGELIQEWKNPDEFAKWATVYPVTIDSAGNFYVASFNNVLKFSPDGQLLSSWGRDSNEYSFAEGQLNGCKNIVIGQQNQVYVFDSENNRVQVFSQAAQAVKVTVDRSKLSAATNTGKITFTNSRNAAETVSVDVTALTEITNTYGQWKALKFTPQQQNDPAVSAESADPDNDGISNILEYAFNLDPLTFNPGKGYQYYLLNNRLTFKFQKNKAAQDITMQIGAKNGLFSSWDYNAMAYTYQDIDASTQIVTATDNTLSTSVPPGTVRLFKLQVTKNGAVVSIMSLAAKPTAEYYTLTVNINGAGTVSSLSGNIKSGSRCTVQGLKGTSEILIATPAQGYKFNGWSGSYFGTSGKCVVAYTAQRQIYASFSPKRAVVAPVKNVAVHQKTDSVAK